MSWPAYGSESLAWEPTLNSMSSRRQALYHRGPYNAAVAPKIAGKTPAISMELLALCEDAIAELRAFGIESGSLTYSFAAVLLRSEAASSSQIENMTASAGAIARAELGLSEGENAKLIVSNQRALEIATAGPSDVDLAKLLAIHEALLAESNPLQAGQIRSVPVWIGGSALGPHKAEYVPPKAEAVSDLLEDFLQFSNRLDLPTMVLIALSHAQFESIHPFTDGNGRTGRALVQLMLSRLGVISSLAAPISAGLLRNKNSYISALKDYRLGNPEPIVRVFAEATLFGVSVARNLAAELKYLRASWVDRLMARSDAGAKLLLDSLISTPVIDRYVAIRKLERTPANAQLAIDKLVEVGILTQFGSAKRNRVWQANEVLDLLERAAENLRRG